MKRLLSCAALASLISLALAAPAQAGSMAPTWDYSVSPLTPVVYSDNTASSIQVAGVSQTGYTGTSEILFAQLSSVSSSTSPDTFTNQLWQVQLTIKDEAAPTAPTTVTLSGHFNGTMSGGSAIISNVFDANPATITVNGNTYTVALNYFVGPSLPGSNNPGKLGALVTVDSVNLGGGSSAGVAPEPSSLLLCGLGSLGLVLTRLRKRKRLQA
jgi:hypothetical protein